MAASLEMSGAPSSTPQSRLLHAILNSQYNVCTKLLDSSLDLNLDPSLGIPLEWSGGFLVITPLMAACFVRDVSMARLLLRAGADPNGSCGDGELILFWAIEAGAEMVQTFVDFGADVDARSKRGWTPLSYARAMGCAPKRYERGELPVDVLRRLGASQMGTGPPQLMPKAEPTDFDDDKAVRLDAL